MIELGIDNKTFINKDKWNYCHHFPILPFLVVHNCLPILNISKNFVYLHNTEERNNEFAIGYMVNPIFHVNKYFK